MQTSVKSVKSQ